MTIHRLKLLLCGTVGLAVAANHFWQVAEPGHAHGVLAVVSAVGLAVASLWKGKPEPEEPRLVTYPEDQEWHG